MSAERVVEVIEHYLANDVVGVAIAVVRGDDVVWSSGFGPVDIDGFEPVTTETVFPIQSVTKAIVATALMPWVERGAIGLDDAVNDHLAPVAIANEFEARSPITIRQLLTHTGGLPVTVGWPASPSLEALIGEETRTEFEPGTRMIYANWGYNALGYLLERLAGTGWDHAVRDSVLAPLGMKATSAGENSPTRPTGYTRSQLDGSHLRLEPWTPPFFPGPPSGALVSTVDDLARFLVAHLAKRVPGLRAETVADMHRLHAPLGAGGGGMGLGFRVDRRNGRAFVCHCGDGDGMTTFIGGHPDKRVGVALAINTAGAQKRAAAIVRAALEWALGETTTATTSAGTGVRVPSGGYRSTYWGIRADIAEGTGEPVLATQPGAIALSEGVSRLVAVDGRFRADGGMFDGCELDFDPSGDRRFVGGLYPLEFEPDDTPIVGLPADVDVDEKGALTGTWSGTTETPIGPIPLELVIDTEQRRVTINVMGTDSVDDHAETANGWVRARLEIDVPGFGAIVSHPRLGLVEGRLQGLLYIRTLGGLVCPTVLEITRSFFT